METKCNFYMQAPLTPMTNKTMTGPDEYYVPNKETIVIKCDAGPFKVNGANVEVVCSNESIKGQEELKKSIEREEHYSDLFYRSIERENKAMDKLIYYMDLSQKYKEALIKIGSNVDFFATSPQKIIDRMRDIAREALKK